VAQEQQGGKAASAGGCECSAVSCVRVSGSACIHIHTYTHSHTRTHTVLSHVRMQGLAYKTGKFSFMGNSRARCVDESEGVVGGPRVFLSVRAWDGM